MDWRKRLNTCQILHQRTIIDNPMICQKIISDRFSRETESLYSRNLLAHFGCVNSIQFSNNGQFLVSGGDDRRVLLWNVQAELHNCGKPVAMTAQHQSNVFCLEFDNSVTHVYSGGNDDQIILHDITTGKVTDVFNLHHPIHCISVDPCNDNIFASAVEDGRILIFDTRLNPVNEPYQLSNLRSSFQSVMFNPVDTRLIATGHTKEGAALWDIRVADKVLMQYGRKGGCMNVRWNQRGTQILALRNRKKPVLYDYKDPRPIVQFSHENYYNSCTIKSCCFAGLNDEYVFSGSDDFNIYMWKIDDAMNSFDKINNVHLILQGHRSIVNHVRFNPHNCIIASSGVEKLIKIWSPMPLPLSKKGKNGEVRKRFTHEEYLSLIESHGFYMSHDYTEQSTSEDPQMMAFFDSLIERDRQGISSDSDDSVCSTMECLNYTAYSSLSDDSDSSTQPVPGAINDSRRRNFTFSENSEALRLRTSRFLSYFNSPFEREEYSSSSLSVSTSSSSSSSSLSNFEGDERNRKSPKLKTKDMLQRLKRIRSSAQSGESSTAVDPTSDRSTLGASRSGVSTDTIDSGVCVSSSPLSDKFKFASFKRNDKRKYRTRRWTCSSSSSDSD